VYSANRITVGSIPLTGANRWNGTLHAWLPQPTEAIFVIPDLDLDIWRAANLLIDQHGVDAENVAIRRAEELNEQNDLGGLLTWMRIREVIVQLQSKPSGMAH
jgi:hypothetical protein